MVMKRIKELFGGSNADSDYVEIDLAAQSQKKAKF